MLAALALGSNLSSAYGEPADNLREALRRLETVGKITAVSSFHITEPVGFLDQPKFVNAAALLETGMGPLELLRSLLNIEQQMGRDRRHALPKGPRIIDLDLLLYEGAGGPLVLHDPDLTLPHPAMHERKFVLGPLAEIAPDLVHPVSEQTVSEMYRALAVR